jgi:hypothetical protein
MRKIVGIVGKPNVGKSTFFSAVTLKSVQIADYPFTTIKANKGIGYVRVKCICTELGVEDNPINSSCVEGNRFIPVELIDCAGLVPGAWQGRGLGNQFLDEIMRADSLIHVIDISGSTDLEGRRCPIESHNPREDIKFLEMELDRWLLNILLKEWSTISRSAEQKNQKLEDILERKFSGLAIKKENIHHCLKKCNLEKMHPTKWLENDLLKFVGELRNFSKPMIIAANKIDIKDSNVNNLRKNGYTIVPCCAEAELALRKASKEGLIEYLPGDKNFTIIENKKINNKQKNALEAIQSKILDKLGTTGIQNILNKVFLDQLHMITVYPVQDPEKLTDHEGRILPEVYLIPIGTTAREFATTIHSDLGEGFLYAIEARSNKRVGEDCILKNNDIISIISTKKRG